MDWCKARMIGEKDKQIKEVQGRYQASEAYRLQEKLQAGPPSTSPLQAKPEPFCHHRFAIDTPPKPIPQKVLT